MNETILKKIIKDKQDWIAFIKEKEPLMSFKYKINKQYKTNYSLYPHEVTYIKNNKLHYI